MVLANSEAQGATLSKAASKVAMGKKPEIKEIPVSSLTDCRVFADRRDMLTAFPISQDVLCLFASNIFLTEELRFLFPENTIHVEGASVRRGEFSSLRILNPVQLQLYESYADVVGRAADFNLGLIAIDRSPESPKFIKNIFDWSSAQLRARRGFLLIRRYAYWRKQSQTNEIVPALNEFLRNGKFSVVGVALNGDGKPDILIRIGV